MAAETAFLRFGSSTLDHYQHFRENVFAGASNSQVFFAAMAFGYHAGIKEMPDFAKSNNGPRTELSESDFVMMKVLQLAVTNDAASLENAQERYDLAMRFAEAGIKLMWERWGHLNPLAAREEILAFLREASVEGT